MAIDDYPPNGATRYPVTADTIDIENQDEERLLVEQVLQRGNGYMARHWQGLLRKGIIDPNGNLLKDDLPADMKENANTDFGG